MKTNTCFKFFIFFCVFIINFICFAPFLSHARSAEENRCIIIYYTRTGNSKVVAETLHQHIKSDLLEVQDKKDRSGRLGYYSAAFDSMFNRYTDIEPAYVDLSPYDRIILVTPIWNWKPCVAIRTALKDYVFKDKRLMLVTLGNQPVDKYETYGDDAPFMKRYFRDYLRGKHKDARLFVKETGAIITGHYHINTEELTDEQISQRALEGLDYITSKLQSGYAETDM